jgi:hypothetical protein
MGFRKLQRLWVKSSCLLFLLNLKSRLKPAPDGRFTDSGQQSGFNGMVDDLWGKD